jgi:hypothetical protein
MTVNPDQTSYMQSSGHDATSDTAYTAVVYFHGIGSQRHYEEVSSLLQQFDQLIYKNHFPGNPRSLQKCSIEVEQGRMGSGLNNKPVTYHKIIHPGAQVSGQPKTVRFYEAYWAAETVGGTNTLSVIAWVLKQAAKPIMVLKSHWGQIGSLRIGTLYGEYERELTYARKARQLVSAERIQTIKFLIASYREFVRTENRYNKENPAGKRGEKFSDYKEFLQEPACVSLYGPDIPKLISAARHWWRKDKWAQFSYFLVIMLLLLLLLGSILFSLWVIYAVLVGLIQTFWPEIQSILPKLGQPDTARSTNGDNLLLILVLLPLTLIVGTRLNQFLSDYLGDVQQYVTYEETDVKYQRRTKILDDTVSLLRHVVLDPCCTRIVVIAHSLGSVIAYDSLLELHRYNLAIKANTQQPDILANPLDSSAPQEPAQLDLDKIQHFVTMGSPIDKTQYFFATLRSRVSRYVETIEAIRGNISTPPFTIPEQQGQALLPQIHWVNYWDQADLISGPIRNVIGADIDIQRVDNVRVVSYIIPEPARSHGGYFYHQNVLGDLYGMIFENRYSFVQAREQQRSLEWVADTEAYTTDAEANWLFPWQKVIQFGVLVVLLLVLGRAVLLIFLPLIKLIEANLFSSPPQPWVFMLTLVFLVVLLFLLSQLAGWLLSWVGRRLLSPRASISVTLPPPPAEPQQAHDV